MNNPTSPTTQADLCALLAFLQVPGIGPVRLAQWLNGRSPAEALRQGPPDRVLHGFPGKLKSALLKADSQRGNVLFEKCRKQDIHLLSPWGEHPFPETWEALPDPPICLFARGKLELLQKPGLAVVGSRGATAYGRAGARMAAREAAHLGLVVWSGLARGVDGEAHTACLQTGGETVAVLGCGVDVVYPREHAELMQAILNRGGLLLSEYLPGTRPLPGHFPRRNRLIAGLTEATLVVEGGQKSGSLITARLALDMGREVMALPHPITSRLGVGPNTLIRMGAALIMNGQDLRDALPLPLQEKLAPPAAAGSGDKQADGLQGDAKKIWSLLPEGESLIADELVVLSGLGAPRVMSLLLELELAGWVRQEAGRYERNR